MSNTAFSVGDLVIYSRPKHSRHPGPRARSIHPAPAGDDYSYVVDKFWIVDAISPSGEVVLRTRRGKTHTIRSDDPLLRKANLWERWRHRDRFPERFPGGNTQAPNTTASDAVASDTLYEEEHR